MNVEEPGEVGTVERVGKMFPVKLVFGFAQHEASYVMEGGGRLPMDRPRLPLDGGHHSR